MKTTPLRVVFDTNVLLSLWVFDKSPGGSRLAPLRRQIEAGHMLALCREDCFAEFSRVLGYPEFRLDPARQQEILREYCAALSWQEAPVQPETSPTFILPRCRDRDDQKFLELARDAAADVLTTGDKALLKLARRPVLAGRFRIITPDQLLLELPGSPAGRSPQGGATRRGGVGPDSIPGE